MRVGELTLSEHIMKGVNVHVALTKKKILIVLYSSKTHTSAVRPQIIRITSISSQIALSHRQHFCPFKGLSQYLQLRDKVGSNDEPFFVFRNGSAVMPQHVNTVLSTALICLGLDSKNYGMHSLCIGRATDMIKFHYSLEQVKRAGRWRSNIVYKYICQ